MDPLFDLLGQLGVGLATNAIYDLLKLTVMAPADREHLEQQIENQIRPHGVTMKASTVIEAVAQHGFITIQGSYLYAPTALAFGSQVGGAVVGNNSTLRTDKTAITAGADAHMLTQGNA
ncbi:MAG: hypothetical protein CFE38_06385 [Comamonadaceae bacterium PBBC1]|nr:MAG: hypothetical protein CFE38_06385 [Comamonadaceae bacterium PBBC1]